MTDEFFVDVHNSGLKHCVSISESIMIFTTLFCL